MTDLTEQWRKGELPEETECYVRVNGGIYLGSIRYKNGCHNKKLPFIKSFNGQFITKHVEEVLAEVPDYVEWKQAQERISKLEKIQYSYTPEEWNMMLKTVNRTREENDNLKDLLKEIRGKIKTVYDMELRAFITSAVFTDDFVKKLDEVLNA